MNIKRNRILGIALCLMGMCLSVELNAAKNADVFYTIQTGVRGTGHDAQYNEGHYGYLPHAWGNGSILYDGTPQLGRNDLMVYTVTPGENGQAKKVTFQYTPTEDYPYLFIYHCEEVYFGEGGHAPFYLSLTVEQDGNPVGCPSRWTWDQKADALAQGYVITNTSWGYGAHDEILYSYKGYLPWQVKAFDLSAMVGKTITITSEACCCSNQKCRSSMMIAFEKDKKEYGGCDVAIKAPSIITPEWHKGSKTSPVYSTNNPLNIESASDTYYLVIPGECQDTIEYSVADTCPCLAPVVLMVDTAVEQENLPYTWHGHIFTGPETYIDTLKNIWGCDSVIYHYSMLAKLTIYADGCDVPNVYWVRPGNDITINANPDNDHKFDRWQDGNQDNPRTFTVYGNQTDTVYFAYNRVTLKVYSQGCETPNIYRDIIAGTKVTVYPIVNEGGAFLRWSDGNIDNPRIITVDTDMSVTAIWKTDQCLDPVTGDTTAVICSKELPYMWHGAVAEDGATWTTENSAGCDSIVTLHLIVNDFSTGDTTAVICSKELPYMWHGAVAEDGATWTTENSAGCDSIVTLHLIVNDFSTGDTTAVICSKELPYMWHGAIAEDGATWTTENSAGCDSIVTLHLIVNDFSTGDTTAVICSKELPYMWHGAIAEDGATWTTENRAGCDSIVTLHLIVNEFSTGDTTAIICSKELPYMWHGAIAEDGATWTTENSAGCDSIVTLHLIVNDFSTGDTTAIICSKELPYMWHGAVAEDGATWTTENSAGCDSIVTLHLIVSPMPAIITLDTMVCDTLMPFTWRGIQYTGDGGAKIDTTYSSNGCMEAITTYTLTTTHCERPVTPPVVDCLDSLVYRKWQDVIFCDNGQREFVSFQWYKDEQLMTGETKQYLYMPGGFGQSFYFVEVTDRNGQKRRTCPETFDDTPRSADTYATFVPVRNSARRWKITVSDTAAELTVWDVLGRLYSSETIQSETEIELPSGIYIVQVKGESGSAKQKLIANK